MKSGTKGTIGTNNNFYFSPELSRIVPFVRIFKNILEIRILREKFLKYGTEGTNGTIRTNGTIAHAGGVFGYIVYIYPKYPTGRYNIIHTHIQ